MFYPHNLTTQRMSFPLRGMYVLPNDFQKATKGTYNLAAQNNARFYLKRQSRFYSKPIQKMPLALRGGFLPTTPLNYSFSLP